MCALFQAQKIGRIVKQFNLMFGTQNRGFSADSAMDLYLRLKLHQVFL